MPTKKIKGNLIRITDAIVAESIDLELDLDPTRVKSSNTDDTYIELDLSTGTAYNLTLPSIQSLGGFLNAQIFITDISGTIDPTDSLTIKVADGSGDTIGGQPEVAIVSKFSGMYITPLSSTQWGTFYTQNLSRKLAAVTVDEEIALFKPAP